MRATITMIDNGYMVDATSMQMSIDTIHVYKSTLSQAIAEITRFLELEPIQPSQIITEEGSQDI